MTLAVLMWGAADWWLPALVLSAIALALLAWGYWRASRARSVRAAAMGLKALAIVLLALCLVEPLLSRTKPVPGANLFAMLADNSQSLTIRDHGAAKSRGDELRSIVGQPSDWQTRLSQDFDVRRYEFDSGLRSVEDFATLKLDGSSSSLRQSLENLARRYRDRPLAGVLLFTDGNATDVSETDLDWHQLPAIYPVILGDSTPSKDLSLAQLSVTQTSFEDAPVTIQAELASVGYRGEKVAVQLLNEAGKRLEHQVITVTDESQPQTVRFQLQPERPGISFYQVRVAPAGKESVFEHPEQSQEATLANNRRLVTVDRGTGPYRVLYVSGRPNWEYKFLRRAVDEDREVQLVALVRIARREPKFDFRGRAGESTNPLFRGFGNQNDDSAETYDKPVLVRLGTEDAAELRDGFPKTAEDLFRYHAVIIDDLEAQHFTPDQMSLVQKFVSQRGGGFLMLGGQESFAGGNYDRTPLGELLPVYLDRLPEVHASEGHRWALEREGWLQPWVRLRSTEPEERTRLQSMPAFQTLNRVRGIKPGATVLARVEDADGWKAPALVEQRYGKGRSLALLVGDMWRWSLERGEQPADLDKCWRQTIRWLVADVPERIEVEARQTSTDASRTLAIRVLARTAQFEPLDNATVTVVVRSPAGEKLELSAAASDEAPGCYTANYVPRQPGAYRAEVSVVGPDGAEIGRRETGWTSDPAADEFRVLSPNRELLDRLARETGGRVVPMAEIDDFVAELPNLKAPITEPSITPLWHTPWAFLIAIACLCGEWGLRRWKGLA
jgi:uncharacterized membrane protein